MINFGVHHIGYAVNDIYKSIEEFNTMGYVLNANIVEDKARNVNICFMKHNSLGVWIELISPLRSGKSPIDKILKKNNNVSCPYHICYIVDNIENVIEELKRKRFYPITDLSPAIAIDNRRVVFLVNKEVGMIELLER